MSIFARPVGLFTAALIFALALSGLSEPALAVSSQASRTQTPARRSPEYQLSWGAGASGADRAYRKGATGEGVVVAMIDTGVDPSAASLFTNLSPESVDLVAGRRFDGGDRRHGEQTASLLAARLDGSGTFGIAYGATLLSIRADKDDSCSKVCAFDPKVLAKAVDYAVDHGARVIGMPFASKQPIPDLEPALERAASRGVVIVAAAGNEGADQPYWPARYASDPRFNTAMIVAGASTAQGRLARWSNRAGSVRERYLVAPGEHVVVDCDTRLCHLTSGTSYSVSYAAGAMALLLSRDPTLSGAEAAFALLDGTRDLGEHGSDPSTGRGRLDVSRALRLVEQWQRRTAG